MIEFRKTTPDPKPAAAPSPGVLRLADDMIDIFALKGCAEEGDLMLRGWPPETLRRDGPEANRLALAATGLGA